MLRSKLSVVLVTSILLAACGAGSSGSADAESPGVTTDTIRLGAIGDTTGPVAFIGQEMRAGADLYVDHVNSEGGVHGRTIDIVYEDDGYQPPRTIAAYRKLVDRDQIFALLYTIGTAPTMALKPMAEREGIPDFGATFSGTIVDPPSRYLFGLDPTYRAQGWIIVGHILDRDPNARIGVIYQDDDMGLDGLEGVREAAAYHGIELVAEEGHRRGAVDFSSQVLNVRRAGATHVALFTVLRETASIAIAASELGWEPELVAFNAVSDDQLVELAGDAGRNLRVLSVLDFESDDPQIRLYRELIETHTPDQRPATYHAFGYFLAQVVVQGLRSAGPDLSRERFIDALETLDGWDENIMRRPVSYGPGVRGGIPVRAFFSSADLVGKRLVRETEDFVFDYPRD